MVNSSTPLLSFFSFLAWILDDDLCKTCTKLSFFYKSVVYCNLESGVWSRNSPIFRGLSFHSRKSQLTLQDDLCKADGI